MKSRILVFGLLLPILLGASAFTLKQLINKDEVLIKLIMKGLNTNHYIVPSLDDGFSQEAYDLYLERLDFSKKFLTQKDLTRLEEYKTNIDNEINDGTYEFFDLSLEILDHRVKQAQSYYKEILDQPFTFDDKGTLELDAKKLAFAKDKESLKERWRSSLKYQTLTRVVSMMEEEKEDKKNDKMDGTPEEPKTFEEIEIEARGKILKNHDNWFKRIDQLKRSDRLATYLNSIVNVYDPHTGYFPPKDKDNFDISMSGRLEGIGARLQEKDGYIEVVNIVPGSPSYLQGELKEGDVILAVAEGAEESVDVVDMPLDDAVLLIRGKKGTEIRLTVKTKLDGARKVIPIIRDVVILEETYAKSLILNNGKSRKNMGYIYLPKFYADFTKSGGRNCAADVEKEIEKLKSQNINGLILDLRNNGGGALQEVVDMAGLFIEKGPIVQVKSRNGAPYLLADRDPKVQFDGPLVIMVNSYSASASEILAAAMQDYNRAVIIGSPSTFGKGTVQRFLDLDNFIRGEDELKPLGAIKLTTQKFYRINGGATQLRGVTPDVIIPDNYTYFDIGEKEHDHTMQWDEISPLSYDTWQDQNKLNKAIINSQKRVDANETFDKVNKNAKRLKKQRDDTEGFLNIEEFRSEQKERKDANKSFKDMLKEIDALRITGLPADLEAIGADTVKQRMANDWKEKVQKDLYIYEALQILQDIK